MKADRLQRKQSLKRRKAENELAQRRLDALQKRIADPNYEESVASALVKEELAIHHNHYLAQQLKQEEHSFLIEVGDYITPMAETNDEDFILQPAFLEKKTSGTTKTAYKELF